MEECRGMFLFFVKIELGVREGGMLVSTLGLCSVFAVRLACRL